MVTRGDLDMALARFRHDERQLARSLATLEAFVKELVVDRKTRAEAFADLDIATTRCEESKKRFVDLVWQAHQEARHG